LIALLVGALGLVLIGASLFDAFETIVVPRRVSRSLRLARRFYWVTWKPYAYFPRTMMQGPGRETFLSFFGPLSLLGLVGTWAIILIIGLAVLQWAVGPILDASVQQRDLGLGSMPRRMRSASNWWPTV